MTRWAHVAAALAVLGAGCVGDTDGTPVPPDGPPVITGTSVKSPGSTFDVARPHIEPAADLLSAADPKLDGFTGWPLAFSARYHDRPGLSCGITLDRDGAVVRELPAVSTEDACVAVWDGLDGAGDFLSPGPVHLTATIEDSVGEPLAVAEAGIEVVRLGIERVQLRGVRAADRVPLLYREVDGVREGFYEVAATRFPWRMAPDGSEGARAVSLDHADGTPREAPAPWDDLASPPLDAASPDGVERDTYSLPTAWVAGALVEAVAALSADVAGIPGGGAPALFDVRVVAPEGTTLAEDGRFADGDLITATSTASPVSAVGRYDWALEWSFEARSAAGQWVPIPGAATTVHRLYGLVAQPVFDYSTVPHRAWVDVVDQVATWVAGMSRDPDEVAGSIVDGVYYDLGLRYDAESGASFYTDYPSGWTGAVFQLSWFQDRDFGSIINCSDAGSILSTYANMVGIDFRYHILTHGAASGFDLNYIQPIGFTRFSETPFTSGRGAFRYHAVVGPPDGRFFDATLALDGDGTPTAPPHRLLLAQGLDPTEYLRDLSSEWSGIVTSVDEKVRVR